MGEIKLDLTLKKSNFLFLPMRQQSRQRNSFFSSFKFDAFSVFTGYDTGCKRSLQP